MAKLSDEVMQAVRTLWEEAFRLNCGMAYEKTHEVLNLLEAAADKQKEQEQTNG